jgi:nicotinamide-nucleotide amidase
MPVAEIIAIGTELLLGEIQDTNTCYLARSLRNAGIDLYRANIVGDNAERIASVIRESLQRSDIIITSGGLGPTVDDPTRSAVALALGTEIEFRPELWDQILERFQRYGRTATENNRRQAYIPRGALAVENAVGTAPAFIAEEGSRVIISLPGVPRELEYLMENKVIPYLQQKFKLGVIKARVLHTAGVGESQIDSMIGDLETLSNPTVGLLAHAGQVDVRITAKAETEAEAENKINEMEQVIIQRLGNDIFGVDAQTLENVVLEKLAVRKWHLVIAAWGMGNDLFVRFNRELNSQEWIVHSDLHSDNIRQSDLLNPEILLENVRIRANGEAYLVVTLQASPEKQLLRASLEYPEGSKNLERSYGGPPANGSLWAVNTILDFVRRNL